MLVGEVPTVLVLYASVALISFCDLVFGRLCIPVLSSSSIASLDFIILLLRHSLKWLLSFSTLYDLRVSRSTAKLKSFCPL
jgi:hypothetical protein